MKFALINKKINKINFVPNNTNKQVEQRPVNYSINNSKINVKSVNNMFSLLKSANRGGCGSCGGAR